MKSRATAFLLAGGIAAAVAAALFSLHRTQALPDGVKISQVYGGGGNSGSTYRRDFVELFNAGPSAVDITGWTMQYASATGATWSATPLTGTVSPGQYFLIQLAGAGGGSQGPAGAGRERQHRYGGDGGENRTRQQQHSAGQRMPGGWHCDGPGRLRNRRDLRGGHAGARAQQHGGDRPEPQRLQRCGQQRVRLRRGAAGASQQQRFA